MEKTTSDKFPIYSDNYKDNLDIPIPFDQSKMICLIEKHHLINITDREKLYKFLSHINYNKIYPFIKHKNLLNITTSYELIEYFNFDSYLSNQLSYFLKYIELNIKNILSNVIIDFSQNIFDKKIKYVKHDVNSYLNSIKENEFNNSASYNTQDYLRNLVFLDIKSPKKRRKIAKKMIRDRTNELHKLDNQVAFLYQQVDSGLYKTDDKSQSSGEGWLSETVTNLNLYRKNSNILQYTIDKYSGNVPIWVTLNHVTFGSASKLLTILNKDLTLSVADLVFNLDSISEDFSPARTSIYTFVEAAVLLRNRVNHSQPVLVGSFQDRKVKLFSKSDKELLLNQNSNSKNSMPIHDINGYMMIVKYFIQGLDSKKIDEWNQFIKNVEKNYSNQSTKILPNLQSLLIAIPN